MSFDQFVSNNTTLVFKYIVSYKENGKTNCHPTYIRWWHCETYSQTENCSFVFQINDLYSIAQNKRISES